MKHGDLELDLFSNSVLDVFLSSFCVLINFFYSCSFFVCVLLYDLHHKINK